MKFATWLAAASCFAAAAAAQESASGIDLRATITAGLIDTHAPALRAVLYPTIKLNDHWSLSGAVQIRTQPYFTEELQFQAHHLKTDVLQGTLNYARFFRKGSFVFRTGALSSTFGSFLLRYDDAINPMMDAPRSYGYYYQPVTTLGLMGAEASGTYGRLDARGQFTNSSPANRRSVLSHDQYGSWAGGGGYTIRQGLRAGISFYTGPYLHRQYAYYFPGEAPPHQLPARAFGIDAQWAIGHWNIQGEAQRFAMEYRLIPTFHARAGYVEIRRVLHPRWFIANRTDYWTSSAAPSIHGFETVIGFRPNTHQIVKVGYGLDQSDAALKRRFQVQLVTTLHPISIARN